MSRKVLNTDVDDFEAFEHAVCMPSSQPPSCDASPAAVCGKRQRLSGLNEHGSEEPFARDAQRVCTCDATTSHECYGNAQVDTGCSQDFASLDGNSTQASNDVVFCSQETLPYLDSRFPRIFDPAIPPVRFANSAFARVHTHPHTEKHTKCVPIIFT